MSRAGSSLGTLAPRRVSASRHFRPSAPIRCAGPDRHHPRSDSVRILSRDLSAPDSRWQNHNHQTSGEPLLGLHEAERARRHQQDTKNIKDTKETTMNKSRLAGLLLAGTMAIPTGMAMAGSAQAASPVQPAAGTVKPSFIGAAIVIQNRGSGKCLDVRGQSLQLAAQVWQWECHFSDPNQNWLIEPVASAPGWVSFRNLHSNLCLDLRAG